MTIGEFIKAYREEHQLSLDEFAARVGCSKAYVYCLESGKNGRGDKPITPGIKMFEKIAAAVGIPCADLLQITGSSKTARATANTVTFNVACSVRCGYGSVPEIEYTDATEEFPLSDLRGYSPDEIRVVRASGDSMAPVISAGDVLVIHEQPDVDSGDVALVSIGDDGEATLKRVIKRPDGVELVPFNEEYPSVVYRGRALKTVRIFGKVIGQKRRW